MSQVKLKGSAAILYGEQIKVGMKAKEFTLISDKLEQISLYHSSGKKRVLSIFPSLDTPVCLKSNKHLNDLAKEHTDCKFYAISADLPFASNRICGIEKMQNISHLSMMQNKQFGMDYGLLITSGPLQGLLCRAVVVIDETDVISYVEIVEEITQEPNYKNLLNVI